MFPNKKISILTLQFFCLSAFFGEVFSVTNKRQIDKHRQSEPSFYTNLGFVDISLRGPRGVTNQKDTAKAILGSLPHEVLNNTIEHLPENLRTKLKPILSENITSTNPVLKNITNETGKDVQEGGNDTDYKNVIEEILQALPADKLGDFIKNLDDRSRKVMYPYMSDQLIEKLPQEAKSKLVETPGLKIRENPTESHNRTDQNAQSNSTESHNRTDQNAKSNSMPMKNPPLIGLGTLFFLAVAIFYPNI